MTSDAPVADSLLRDARLSARGNQIDSNAWMLLWRVQIAEAGEEIRNAWGTLAAFGQISKRENHIKSGLFMLLRIPSVLEGTIEILRCGTILRVLLLYRGLREDLKSVIEGEGTPTWGDQTKHAIMKMHCCHSYTA